MNVTTFRLSSFIIYLLWVKVHLPGAKKEEFPLNWSIVWETVEKYWVQQVCILLMGLITW